MDGYFVFTVQVTDSRNLSTMKQKNLFLISAFSAPEEHTDTASVQVFIITDSNRVELTFENPLSAVIRLQDTVNFVKLC